MDEPKLSPFGAYLKQLRESSHLSLEQVARRFGTDRANIHRIESGRGRPQHETIERLVDALEATPSEAMELYERAGYRAPVWPTTVRDFSAVRRAMRTEWLSDGPPATLVIDVFWTVWHVNASFAGTFTSCQSSQLIGRNYLAVCLDPQFGFRQAVGQIATVEDIEAFLLVVMSRFRRRFLAGQGGIKSDDDLARLQRLPDFSTLWNRAEQPVAGDQLSGLVRLNLRDGGCIFVGLARVLHDKRFLLIHYLPGDAATASALDDLRTP